MESSDSFRLSRSRKAERFSLLVLVPDIDTPPPTSVSMDRHPVREYLEQISVNELVIRIALLRNLFNDLNSFSSIEALERDLDRTLSAHLTIYFERSFALEQLEDLPRYKVYRFHAFGTPIIDPTDSDSTSGDASPVPIVKEE